MTSRSPRRHSTKLEGPGPDRLPVVLGRVEVDPSQEVLRDDARPRIDQDGEERPVGIPQPEADRVVVDDLDRFHGELLRLLRIVLVGELREADQRVEVGAMGRRDLGIEHGVERECDVAGREGLAVVPLHALLELERVGEAVPRDLPRFREQRLHAELLVQLDQAVEHRPLRDVGLAVGGHHGVQARRVAEEPDDEVLSGGGGVRRGAKPQAERERQDQREHGRVAHETLLGVT